MAELWLLKAQVWKAWERLPQRLQEAQVARSEGASILGELSVQDYSVAVLVGNTWEVFPAVV
jgi:hypothetical protein